jgi:hypothetical protein
VIGAVGVGPFGGSEVTNGPRHRPARELSGLARNFGDVFVGPLCGGGEGGVFVGGDALE